MKERLIGLIKTYILFVCIFILQKPLFILYYSSLYAGTSWTDPFKIIWNGLPLDLSLAGYLTAIPGLFFIASAWTLSKALRRIWIFFGKTPCSCLNVRRCFFRSLNILDSFPDRIFATLLHLKTTTFAS